MFKKSSIKGSFAELLALFYLILKGYKPLITNDKSFGIESDIIAIKGNSVVLVEVKWRQSKSKTHRAVHPSQQLRLQRKLNALTKKYPNQSLRVDLVLICPTPPFIEHIKNAFSL